MFFHAVDELAVGNTFGAGGIIYACNPKCAKIAFFVTAVAVGIAERFNDALFGETETPCAVMLHAFGGF